MKLDVLAIGAHPDDVELACGGTILRLVAQGRSVGIIDLTEGELGTRGTREIRAREAADAATILGVSLRENLRIPDGHITPSVEHRVLLVRAIRKYTPAVLLMPFGVDRHPDHCHAHTLCKEAWFYSGLQRMETMEESNRQLPFRPKSYYCYMQWHEFQPSFVVDISRQFEQRMKAVLAYKSQFFDPESREPETVLSSEGFLDMVRTRLAYYGDKIGVPYGEPFHTPHVIRIDDLYAL